MSEIVLSQSRRACSKSRPREVSARSPCVRRAVFGTQGVHAGDTHLSGEDFDSHLVAHCADVFKKKFGKDLLVSEKAKRRLRTACGDHPNDYPALAACVPISLSVGV